MQCSESYAQSVGRQVFCTPRVGNTAKSGRLTIVWLVGHFASDCRVAGGNKYELIPESDLAGLPGVVLSTPMGEPNLAARLARIKPEDRIDAKPKAVPSFEEALKIIREHDRKKKERVSQLTQLVFF